MIWNTVYPSCGSIVRVKMNGYYHYGIYESDSSIIQFGYPDNSETDKKDISVNVTDIDAFSGGRICETATLEKKERAYAYTASETIKRARERIGEKGYDMLTNNCEHFVRYCAFGKKKSFFSRIFKA